MQSPSEELFTAAFLSGHMPQALKIDKSPGSDGIPNKILKIGSATLNTHLTDLFNLIIETGDTPT